MRSLPDVESTVVFQQQLTAMLKSALKKWASNAEQMLQNVPREHLTVQ